MKYVKQRHLPALVVVGLFALTLLLYAPVRHLPFVAFDDDNYVTENPKVREGLTAKGILWALTSVGYAGNWHPATWVSHMIDVEFFGLNPGGHHLMNAGLHAVNAALVFVVLRVATGALWSAALVAALFAAHPLRVESVAWVAERKDVLSSFFGLLAIGAWVRYARRPGVARYFVAVLFLALGLMTKPMLVTIPAVLLIFDWWPLGRWRRIPGKEGLALWGLVVEKFPLLALAVVAAVLALVAQRREGALNLMDEAHQGLRYATALLSYVRYLGKLLWPQDLAVLYAYPSAMPSVGKLAAALSLIGGSLAAALALRRRAPWVGFGVGWYLITLFPVIGIVKIGMSAGADRYTYLPLLGIVVLMVWSLRQTVARRAGNTLHISLLLGVSLLLLVLGWLTRLQIDTWRSSQALFDRVRHVDPEAYRRSSPGEYNLAVELSRQGRFDEAKMRYEELVRTRPTAHGARNNLAGLLLQEGRAREAETLLRTGLSMAPQDLKMLDNLGVALGLQGRYQEAFEQFAAALAVNPRDPMAYNNIGHTWERLGDDERAAAAYREAVRLAPDDPGPALRLQATLERQGNRTGSTMQR